MNNLKIKSCVCIKIYILYNHLCESFLRIFNWTSPPHVCLCAAGESLPWSSAVWRRPRAKCSPPSSSGSGGEVVTAGQKSPTRWPSWRRPATTHGWSTCMPPTRRTTTSSCCWNSESTHRSRNTSFESVCHNVTCRAPDKLFHNKQAKTCRSRWVLTLLLSKSKIQLVQSFSYVIWIFPDRFIKIIYTPVRSELRLLGQMFPCSQHFLTLNVKPCF